MLYKTIKIDLREDDQVVYDSGYIGEVNHRKLEVYPPPDLTDAGYFMLAFDVAGETLRPPVSEAGNRIRASLAPPVTGLERVGMTLEGYRADGTIIGKSRMVILRFFPSANGPAGDFGGIPGPPGPPGEGVEAHAALTVFGPEGVHGIRYHNDTLQVFDGEQWIDVSVGTSAQALFDGTYLFDGTIDFNN